MQRGKGVRAMTPADFMAEYDTSPLSPEELQAKIDACMTAAAAGPATRKAR